MPDDTESVSSGDPFVFDAVLRPHRSLGPRGFFILMAAVAAVSFAAGVVFLSIGAWPVPGFLGLDVLLIYIAFRVNYRAARRYETVRLSDAGLTVRAVDPKGEARSWSFDPYWVRITVDELSTGSNRLVLSSHGKQLNVGAFLTPEERVDLADALRDALVRFRAAPS